MNKIKSLKDKLIEKYKVVKRDHLVKKYFNDNRVFVLYIIINLINSTALRFMCMPNETSILSLKPVFADLVVLVLLGSFHYLIKRNKFQVLYLAILTFIFTVICTANSIYYTYYTSFASFSMLSLTQFIAPVGDAVVQNVLQIKDLVYLIPMIAFYVYLIMTRKKYKYKLTIKKTGKTKFFKTLITSLCMLACFCLTLSGLEISRFVKQWNKEYIVQKFGIYIYQLNDGVTSLQPKINSMFGYDKALKSVKEYYENRNNYDGENEYTNIFKGKNVLVIHAESLQTFTLNTQFNGVDVAPNFKKLASEGIYFSNYYSQVSVGTSSDAELTFNTSLMPTKSGTAFVSYSDRKYIAMPSLLKDMGYYTFSMHGNTADFWNRRVMHQNFGFDRFYSKVDYNVTKENSIGLGISDKEFFKQSTEYIEQISKKHKNFYGVLITLTNHTPFSETTKYGEYSVSLKVQETDENGNSVEKEYPYMEGTKLGNYFKSVHYADQAMGEFIQELDDKGLLDNTVIVIYGDHDARLSKDDYVRLYNYDKENDDVLDEEDPNYTQFDSYQYELNRKVPFIIWTKDKKYNFEVKDTMGMYDAMPTLGNMLGFKNKYALGHDIFNIKSDNLVVFPNGNWVTNKVYYNAQKGEYLALSEEAIEANYIEEQTSKADELLDVSNDVIVFNMIKKIEENGKSK